MATTSDSYLQPSFFCNSESFLLREFAEDLTTPLKTAPGKAVAIFNWVRDNIEYELGLRADTAAQTLARGKGSCTNKANLIVALARAVHIPAAFQIMKVKTKYYFGPVCTPRFARLMSEESLHVYVSLRLQDRWVRCDATDDKKLCDNSSHLCQQSELVVFNGQDDALIQLNIDHVISDDKVLLPDIDFILKKNLKIQKEVLKVMNLYLRFIRLYGRSYDQVASLERSFFLWLEANFPKDYLIFLAVEKEIIAAMAERVTSSERPQRQEIPAPSPGI